MAQQCSNCSAMAQVIQKQQAEIQRLKRIITDAQNQCEILERENKQQAGVSKGVWSYARGAREAAQKVKVALR